MLKQSPREGDNDPQLQTKHSCLLPTSPSTLATAKQEPQKAVPFGAPKGTSFASEVAGECLTEGGELASNIDCPQP